MTKLLIKLCLLICVSLASEAVLAGPVRCSVNNQDSSCLTPITTAWQTAPTCPPSAGWTTIAPAQWIGSQYSAPNCNYQSPPTCPGGFHETVGASWNGSSWVGQQCQPNATQPTDPVTVCTAAAASHGLSFGPATAIVNKKQDAHGVTYLDFFPTYGVYYDEAGYSGNEWILGCNVDASGNVIYSVIFDYSSYFQTVGGGGG
ncbi:hypothetical protein SAMN05192544_104934 [Paraburkholderia hospita]|nr:hypothetical protein SAMN05192544_104934 [Paraburkholderia hospita]